MFWREKVKYPCPVCGYAMNYPPAEENICPSCGVQFGSSDYETSYDELRLLWLSTGPIWSSPVQRQPANWDPFKQMTDAGIDYVNSATSRLAQTGMRLEFVGSSQELTRKTVRVPGPILKSDRMRVLQHA